MPHTPAFAFEGNPLQVSGATRGPVFSRMSPERAASVVECPSSTQGAHSAAGLLRMDWGWPVSRCPVSRTVAAESSSLAEPTFVPTGFIVPLVLLRDQFRLEPLGPTHNNADYEAWSSSADHIHATPGWENSAWPDRRTSADNLRDLQRHADDFRNRKGFTYTVLEPQSDDVVGCVYIYPDRTGATDAHVQSWVRASRARHSALAQGQRLARV